MTTDQLAATLFYASLATFAVLATWRGGAKRQVGLVLFACWVASNVIFWTLPIEWRPSIFPILDVLFALTAAKAGKETDSRVPLIIIALSVMAVTVNAAFSIVGAQYVGQILTYEVALNVIFAAQCLVTGGWGLADALGRFVRFDAGAGYLRRRTQSSDHPTSEEGP